MADDTEPNELKNKLKNLSKDEHSFERKKFYLLQTWAIYLDSSLFKCAIDRLSKLIENRIGLNNFDYICAVPTCGVPISAGLSLSLEKPLIVPHTEGIRAEVADQFHIQKEIKPKKKIVLVDAIINSGVSARITKDNLKSIDGEFVGLAVLLYNDKYPEKIMDKFRLEEKEKIMYIFKVSDLI